MAKSRDEILADAKKLTEKMRIDVGELERMCKLADEKLPSLDRRLHLSRNASLRLSPREPM